MCPAGLRRDCRARLRSNCPVSGYQDEQICLTAEAKEPLDNLLKHRALDIDIELPKKIPRCGAAICHDGGKIEIIREEATRLHTCKGLGYTIVPEPVAFWRTRPLPKGGLINNKKSAPIFGTLRRHSASHQRSSALTVRGHKDMPNVILLFQGIQSVREEDWQAQAEVRKREHG